MKKVAFYNLSAFVTMDHIVNVSQEFSSPHDVNFLSNYLSAVAYKLGDQGYEPVDEFRKIASTVIPYGIFQDTFLADPALFKARFDDKAKTVQLLLSNPLVLCIVILRLNMDKIMLMLNPLMEYREAIRANPTE